MNLRSHCSIKRLTTTVWKMSFSSCFSSPALCKATFKYTKLSKIVYKPLMTFERRLQQKIEWIEPKGYDTGVSVFNSFSKTKVSLKTLKPGLLTWYSCGPTVYDSSHLGHAKCYVQLDTIRRILQDIFQINVVQVTGITDVDDKIIARANELNTDSQTISRKYEEEFFNDMFMLNVMSPSLAPRVTDNILPILAFIQKIIDNKLAYVIGGTVYFDSSSYNRFGKLAVQDESKQIPSESNDKKKSPRDFALWKASKPGEPFWDSLWGPGRPGWHIECSAMACQIFGDKLDLHSGGFDLLFPHHENEEAQCCAHYNYDQWCSYWIHTGHLSMNGSTKMSKSLSNTILIENFLKEHSANSFRMLCLFSHYKSSLEYTSELIAKAEGYCRKFEAFFEDSQAYLNGQIISGPLDDPALFLKLFEVQKQVKDSLSDNFNTRNAMQSLLELISHCNRELAKKSKVIGSTRSLGLIAAVRGYVHRTLNSFGLKFKPDRCVEEASGSLSHGQTSLIMDSVVNFRQEVKNFALVKESQDSEGHLCVTNVKERRRERLPLLKACDDIRTQLSHAGIQIKDHSGTSAWHMQEGKPSSGNDDSGKER